jgi:hypothetical protein
VKTSEDEPMTIVPDALFEGGPGGMYDGVQLAVFNLTWLLDGADVRTFLTSQP